MDTDRMADVQEQGWAAQLYTPHTMLVHLGIKPL